MIPGDDSLFMMNSDEYQLSGALPVHTHTKQTRTCPFWLGLIYYADHSLKPFFVVVHFGFTVV